MASQDQIEWLKTMKAAAIEGHHKWPGCAAAEAAAETGWGVHIPHGSNNVLGIKSYKGWSGPVVGAIGSEQNKDGTWSAPQNDLWCVFGSPAECFAEQMVILHEQRYTIALAATTPEDYIREECKVWSTGILKGVAVASIYHAHEDVLA